MTERNTTDDQDSVEDEICSTLVTDTEPGPPGADYILVSGTTKSKYVISGFKYGTKGCYDTEIPFILKYTETEAAERKPEMNIAWIKYFSGYGSNPFLDIPLLASPIIHTEADVDQNYESRSGSLFFAIFQNRTETGPHPIVALNTEDGSFNLE